jgi:excisionase family DNA binding protein
MQEPRFLRVSATKAPAAPESWVDASRIAAHIGASRSYVLALALRGEIPAVALPSSSGKRCSYRFKLSLVDAWLEARRIKAVRS